MQLGEVVAATIMSSNHDEDCYFCNAKSEPEEGENALDDDHAEDEDLDGMATDAMKFKNDASKLGKALGGDPGRRTVDVEDEDYPSSTAAHHLIPGNAALKKSKLFKSNKYLWKNGKAKGNIGYNINAAANGEWLPGNYAIRPWGTKGATFAKASGVEPKVYAFRCIDAWGAQFHDAHEDYSTFVHDALNKLFQKLERGENVWCPEAKKEEDDPEKRSPLYVLVNRLNTISSRMHTMLVFPTTNWKKNIWTSAFSLAYMGARPHRKRTS